MEIRENIPVKDFCTLKVGGVFRYISIVKNIDELIKVFNFAKEKNIKVLPIGGGSNLVFNDDVINVIAVKIEIDGFEILNEKDDCVELKIGAGMNWDEFVSRTVDMNLSGVEALSAIPGTVGATPVQNVGAYGSEVKDTILEVEVFDSIENKVKIFSNKDCQFSYRDSIFKHTPKGVYIITAVKFRLSKDKPEIPNYPGVKKYFTDNNINNFSVEEIRKAIISIRKNKLPNPYEISNAGSFFKNPILSKEILLAQSQALGYEIKDIPTFDMGENMIKIPAGWLIENSGLKGYDFGNISVYKNNALVLVNNGNATNADLMSARNFIVETVYKKFGITLEQEPEII